LHSSWGTSSTDMYSVGDGGTILHFDGTTWTKMQSGTALDLQNIWGTDDQHIWTAGWNFHTGKAEVLIYDGSTWQEDALELSGEAYKWGLSSVWACDSAQIPCTFVSGSQLFRRSVLGNWRLDDSDRIGNHESTGSYIGVGIRGNTPNDLIAAGSWGFAAHWNGKSWFQFKEMFEPGNGSFGTSGISMSGNTICVVGEKSGASWVAIGQR